MDLWKKSIYRHEKKGLFQQTLSAAAKDNIVPGQKNRSQ